MSEHTPSRELTRGRRAILLRAVAFAGLVVLLLVPMPSSLPYESMIEPVFSIRERLITREDFDDGSYVEQLESGPLVFEGEINKETALRLMWMIRTRPAPTKLVVTSTGGSVLWADRLGRVIERASIPVYVEHYCNSACVELLIHARKAVVWLGAGILLHRPSRDQISFEGEDLENFLARDRALFRGLGVDPAALDMLREYDEWPLTIGELARGGFIDQVIDPSTGREVDAREFCKREPGTCDPEAVAYFDWP